MEHTAAAQGADKKRNKLGYHRTSVACTHCRRRKIRCVPSGNSGRCENCIRLKKECRFHPVDQQPPPEKRSHYSSKSEASSLANPPIVPSSPPNAEAAKALGRDEMLQYAPLALTPGQDIPPMREGPFASAPISPPYHSPDTSSIPNFSAISSPLSQPVAWNNPAFFDPSMKEDSVDPGWNQAAAISPIATPAGPATTLAEQVHAHPHPGAPLHADMEMEQNEPVIWPQQTHPQLTRAISFESPAVYAHPLQPAVRRMTVPTPSEMYMDTYENTMPVPEVPPGPSSPVSYGLDPMGHYQSLNPYLGGPEMMPVSGATSTSTSPHPASVPHPEMPQAGWYDPQQQNMHYRDGQIHGVPLNHQ